MKKDLQRIIVMSLVNGITVYYVSQWLNTKERKPEKIKKRNEHKY